MDHSLSTPLIVLGRIVATPGARENLKKANQLQQHFLDRHVREIGVGQCRRYSRNPAQSCRWIEPAKQLHDVCW